MRFPSGEICGSPANCRLKTSIAVRRSDFSCDLSSFFSCAKAGIKEVSNNTTRVHRQTRRCMARAPGTRMETDEVYRREVVGTNRRHTTNSSDKGFHLAKASRVLKELVTDPEQSLLAMPTIRMLWEA